jgi:hypothetical protein
VPVSLSARRIADIRSERRAERFAGAGRDMPQPCHGPDRNAHSE